MLFAMRIEEKVTLNPYFASFQERVEKWVRITDPSSARSNERSELDEKSSS